VGFVVDKVGQVFSEYFGEIITHNNHPSSGAGTVDQIVADEPSGLSLTPPQDIKNLRKLSILHAPVTVS
jgi:hypothetical protein